MRSVRAHRACLGFVVFVVSSAASCGGAGDAPCMSMGTMSDVLGRAQLVRLDVYDRGAHCDGARVADGAPPPSLSKSAAAGQPIKLDVPAGHHVLLLSAFADSTGAELLGSACVETDVKASQPACFNLTLADVPDLGSSSDAPDLAGTGGDVDLALPGCGSDGDCAATPATPHCKTDERRCVECLQTTDCPLGKQCSPSGACVDGCVPAAPNCAAGEQCCSNLCIDTSKDVSSCGACGRACSSAHVTMPTCANKLCAPTCAAGWGDCNHPVAPNPDDGCETNLYDVTHCGACNAPACNLPHATPDCPAGSCTIKTCSANYFDCNGKAGDGCECPGQDLGGTAGGCCPGNKCQTAHTTGFGASFYDCETSYSEQLARDAAKAAGYATPFGNNCGTGMSEKVICGKNTGVSCTCWVYADSASANNATGRARQNLTNDTCYCPTSGDQPWN